ncbi:tyrosine-protein phosphatase non-receptor-like protein 2 [Dinothrombium tinctorium]|uniref:Tyrosine-protein phosphatase non-receptor-like protein 2 n=1 Tax=Dinothrombium tinctorium TaxID=1965070 RepID=A0A3S3SN35_9ACAR|nr:tyrosine-protein phosphatase non-receptor-like protein 2 [Dinothrombium tinctorium]
MENIRKLPMLLFEQKSSQSSVDFASVLRKKIRECFNEDPQSYSKEIKELESLRNKAVKASRDVNGCSLLKRYYSQLCLLQNRFKGLKESELQFSWIDVYKGNVVTGNLQLELDAIMYNIGALHGELGAIDTRSRAESMKVACTHFQCAAWAFEQLRDNAHSHKSKDMSHEIVSFMYQIMLAQAQECILEKSILDNRKASIIAKVAAQVIEYYNSALLVLLQAASNGDSDNIIDIVGSKMYKEWKKFVEFKISYYGAICSLYMGNFCEEQQKMGERVAWYMSAEEKLNDAMKQSKGIDRSEIDEALNFLSEVIIGKLTNSKKENDFVYHEAIPTSDKLTAVKGASLVKGIGFSVSDKEVCGNDIFARLIPIEAHELASVYSEKKDKIIRDISNRIQDKDQDLVTYMSSLQLDRDSLRPTSVSIPDELIEICAAMSVKQNALAEAKEALNKLEELCKDVDKNIKEARRLINEEEEKEREHQNKFGKRAPSMIIMELSKELSKHEETHKQAVQSNANLRSLLEQNADDIQLLANCSAKDLESLLPPPSNVPIDEKNLKEIEKLLEKVNEMKDQRVTLEKQLRDSIQKDDILKKVLSHSQNEIENIFESELKKYDYFINLLNQNMDAQENILNALTKENAKYVETRKALLEHDKMRRERIEQLISAYETLHQVISGTQKGHEFYKKFENIIARLLARVRSVTRVQDEERMQFIEVHTKKERFTNYGISQAVPKLKDYLPFMNSNQSQPMAQDIGSLQPQKPPINEMTSYQPPISCERSTTAFYNPSNYYQTTSVIPTSSQVVSDYSVYTQPSSAVTSTINKPEVAQDPKYVYQAQPQYSQSTLYQNYENTTYKDQYPITSQPVNNYNSSFNQNPSQIPTTFVASANQPIIADPSSNYYVQQPSHSYSAYTPGIPNTQTVATSYVDATSYNNVYASQAYTSQNFTTTYDNSTLYQPASYNNSYSQAYVGVPSNTSAELSQQQQLYSNSNQSQTYINGHNYISQNESSQPVSSEQKLTTPTVAPDSKKTQDPNNLLSQFDPL